MLPLSAALLAGCTQPAADAPDNEDDMIARLLDHGEQRAEFRHAATFLFDMVSRCPRDIPDSLVDEETALMVREQEVRERLMGEDMLALDVDTIIQDNRTFADNFHEMDCAVPGMGFTDAAVEAYRRGLERRAERIEQADEAADRLLAAMASEPADREQSQS
ncbi:hypothetical protein [Aurantiacibacter gangjinensis]|uniref:hypothetical protein n=1 Tax=Aurantiacibacter gangjinensis TaxID=502682 RepID=UPI0012E08BDE|nr:hypothetical protein [Aurantiacibacter gangjinensis]